MLKNSKLVTFVIGTRPEAIKMSPLILEFKKNEEINTRVILSGQHQEMVSEVLKIFNIEPSINFNIMKLDQSLSYITSSTLDLFSREFNKNRPNLLFVQGDTNTAFSAALAAFYMKIPVAHVEAGLRSDDIYNPFPEEVNRRLISQIATLHFAPTIKSKENLLSSNIKGEIYVCGNSVIDALLLVSKKLPKLSIKGIDFVRDKLILVTLHRRENWGKGIFNICRALIEILKSNKEHKIIIPMHANHKVRDTIKQNLEDHPRVILIEPLNYLDFISLMKNSKLILTDSGGVQEEAPSFRVPTLVLRKTTERSEAIDQGFAKLVGTDQDLILIEANNILKKNQLLNESSKKKNPFGDGKTSKNIYSISLDFLGKCQLT